MLNNRQEDLSKVFDKRWKANHNDDVKLAREKEKKFMNEMFGTNNREKVKPLTPGERASNLQNNINNAFSGPRTANVNNIVKKWKWYGRFI